MATQNKAYSLDIFTLLEQINNKDYFFYEELTDEERKGFVPLLTMRWLSGTDEPAQIVLLNEVVNPYVFSLHNHRNLLYKLLTICAVKPQKYKWIKNQSKNSNKLKHVVALLCKHYNYSSRRVLEIINFLSNEQILQIAEQHGLQQNEIQEIKKELKYR